MIKRGMSLTEALATVRARRDIFPNEGFLRQLQQLDRELRVSRVRWPYTPINHKTLYSVKDEILNRHTYTGRRRVASLDRAYYLEWDLTLMSNK